MTRIWLITLDYYNTNILPLVTQEISTQLTSYNKYNDYLKILDENYEKQSKSITNRDINYDCSWDTLLYKQ